jgi:hypothetical protein
VGLGETSGVVGLDLVEMGCAMRLVAGCFCRMVDWGRRCRFYVCLLSDLLMHFVGQRDEWHLSCAKM